MIQLPDGKDLKSDLNKIVELFGSWKVRKDLGDTNVWVKKIRKIMSMRQKKMNSYPGKYQISRTSNLYRI